MEKKNLLFIDDEANVLNALKRILRNHTNYWNMDFAGGVDDALALMGSTEYDAILSDVMMPGKTGLDLLQHLADDEQTQEIPVIILTGLQQTDLKRQALDLGAVDLLNKPVQPEDLLARIRSVLKLKSYRDELCRKNAILEEQLIQAQKMEMIGILAAGAFHDIRNVLTIISSYSQLAKADPTLLPDSVQKIDESINLASQFMSQILQFSRPQEGEMAPCDLGPIISQSLVLIKKCLPKNIKIDWQEPLLLPVVKVNRTQIFQVLMNLCINAAHAMEDPGTITVAAGTVDQCPQTAVPSSEETANEYVRVVVSDTGFGMEDTTIANLFEPFFTKKETNKGIGLGMNVVNRIMTTHAGRINVISTVGEGTTFELFFAVASPTPISAPTDIEPTESNAAAAQP